MNIMTLREFVNSPRYQKVMQRSKGAYDAIMPAVRDIMDAVKERGDDAVVVFTEKFDKVKLNDVRVSKEEIARAYNVVDKEFLAAIDQMIKNVTAVHKGQLSKGVEARVEPEAGIVVWKEWRPIERVGIYIPGGKANYPSTVVMTAVPARIAGCKEIILITPPSRDGTISPYVAVAADRAGVSAIFKAGGAQAIAALSFGTESIPKVYKIFGPGNAYVTAAKLELFARGEVAIDSPAGPSEVFIIADETANPRWVAADLLADGEHGDDSACVVVTTSRSFAERVVREVEDILKGLPTRDRAGNALENYGACVVVETLDEAMDFANEYAPEHLEIMTRNADALAQKAVNAGSVFIGEYTCKSSGDYATGANHVLPTGGAAKMFSGLSVLDFVKLVEFQRVTRQGLVNIRGAIEAFAKVERLPAHKYSCQVRFESKSYVTQHPKYTRSCNSGVGINYEKFGP